MYLAYGKIYRNRGNRIDVAQPGCALLGGDNCQFLTFHVLYLRHHLRHLHVRGENLLLRCLERLLLSENRLPHSGKSHRSGRSPVWTLLCIVIADP